MAIDIAKLLVMVGADISGAENGLQKVSKGLDNLSSRATAVGKTMMIGVTAPLVTMGTMAVMSASDVEESMNKVGVVFGDTADEVKYFSRTAATQLGISRQAALEAAGTFGNLFVTMGLGQEAAADMSMEMVKLASDLGSFNNIDPTVVLEKLRSGLVGEVEPLRVLGVNVQESAVQLKAMEMGLAATAEELTNQDKVMARYALIMEQTGTAQGDFARTSDGLANQMRIMRASVSDAAAAFGQVMIPYVKVAADRVIELIAKFQGMDQSTRNLIVTVGAITAAMGPLSLAIGAVTKAASVLATVLGVLGGPVTLIIAGVAMLATSIYMLVDANKKLQEENQKTARTTQESFELMKVLSGEEMRAAGSAHNLAFGFDALGNKIDFASQKQQEAITEAQKMARSQEELAQAAENTAMALVQTGLSGELATGIETYTETIARLREEYMALSKAAEGWNPKSSKVKDLADAMSANATEQERATAAMREATTEMIFQKAAAGLDAQSTLTLARAMGVLSEQDYAVAQTIQNLKTSFTGLDGVMDPTEAAGYAKAVEGVNQAAQNLVEAGLPVTFENIGAELEKASGWELASPDISQWTTMSEEASTSVTNLKTSFETNMSTLPATATTAVTGIKTAFGGEAEWQPVGLGVADGMAAGIVAGIPQIEAAARLAAQKALAAARLELGIQSPSKEFAWVGEQTMAGMALGIRENAKMPVREAAYAANLTTAGATYYSTYSPNVTVSAHVASEIDIYRMAQEIADEIRMGRM